MSDRIAAVYIVTNKKNGTLYIGSTNDLYRRATEHKQSLIKGFSKQYGLTKLVYAEPCPDVTTALLAERRYKKYKRQWKINLIEKMNPNWDDLSEKPW